MPFVFLHSPLLGPASWQRTAGVLSGTVVDMTSAVDGPPPYWERFVDAWVDFRLERPRGARCPLRGWCLLAGRGQQNEHTPVCDDLRRPRRYRLHTANFGLPCSSCDSWRVRQMRECSPPGPHGGNRRPWLPSCRIQPTSPHFGPTSRKRRWSCITRRSPCPLVGLRAMRVYPAECPIRRTARARHRAGMANPSP